MRSHVRSLTHIIFMWEHIIIKTKLTQIDSNIISIIIQEIKDITYLLGDDKFISNTFK